jgi:hypothetical protein
VPAVRHFPPRWLRSPSYAGAWGPLDAVRRACLL